MTNASASPPAETRPALLDVRDVSVAFEVRDRLVPVLDRVSFSVGRGETVGVVGESGSGKSVLVRTAMRLAPPNVVFRGEIDFEGQRIDRLGPRSLRDLWGARMSMVFQDPLTALNPVMRIEQQVTESIHAHEGLPRAEARERALVLLRSVGIPDPARRLRAYPHELSGGMRQRVAIAAALACGPELLFADEPTTALDVTIQQQILTLLASFRAQGLAMVLVSHDLAVVRSCTDRVLVMYGGRVVESGRTTDIFRHPRHPYTLALLRSVPRMGTPPHTRLAVIPGRAVQGADPTHVGCQFAPRCERAQPHCVREAPPVEVSGDGSHTVRCFHPNDSGIRAVAADLRAGR